MDGQPIIQASDAPVSSDNKMSRGKARFGYDPSKDEEPCGISLEAFKSATTSIPRDDSHSPRQHQYDRKWTVLLPRWMGQWTIPVPF